MSGVLCFSDADWDFPFFKILSSNDTGSAPGHQGGMVIPKDIRQYFPRLSGKMTKDNPTIDESIRAVLVVNGHYINTVSTRYQYQSWKGERSPESRLTGNLGDIRGKAREGDILVIQRNREKLDLYRLWLITQDNPQYSELRQTIGSKRWGLLTADIPVTEDDIKHCEMEEHQIESSPFSLFDSEIRTAETRSRRIARSLVFKMIVQRIYKCRCAVCDTGLMHPDGNMEIEAAHIVPRRCHGSDDARNGLAFCRRHHWAFDHGLFGITDNREIYIPPKVLRISANQPLLPFERKRIIEAAEAHLMADNTALQWHFKNILAS